MRPNCLQNEVCLTHEATKRQMKALKETAALTENERRTSAAEVNKERQPAARKAVRTCNYCGGSYCHIYKLRLDITC